MKYRFSVLKNEPLNNIDRFESSESPTNLRAVNTSPLQTRRNSLVSNPESYMSPGFSASSLRRSSTVDRQPNLSADLPPRGGSFSWNSAIQDIPDVPFPTSTREGSITPNYSRYSSLLDDKHDWGFRTLRRRNSRLGLSKILPQSDDINF